MSVEDIQQKNNSKALKIAWSILIIAIITISFDVYFLRKNYLHSVSQQKFLTLVETQKEEITQLNVQILLTIQDTNYVSSIFKRDLLDQYIGLEKRNDSFLFAEFTDGLNSNLFSDITSFHQRLKIVNEDFFGVSKLVLDKNKGAFENKDLILTQLSKETNGYTSLLYEMQKWSIRQTNIRSTLMYTVLLVTGVLFMFLAIFGYLYIIIPIKSNHQLTRKLLADWESKVVQQNEVAQKAISKQGESELHLKTKLAQTHKLQKSLEVSISKINQAKNEKNLIYYNIASDLSDYLNIIKLQLSILENQNEFGLNTHWVSLTNTISNLNEMASDYFNRSKQGHHSQNNSDVYLSQLMSEILISGAQNKNLSFQQVSDMPSITTNETLLKRVLQPYIEIMSPEGETKEVINISAKENESICEIKFIGLPISFKERLKHLTTTSISDYTLLEFKIHMSNKTIEERGGKQWLQFDIGQKGVYIIHWVL